jgi:hypothetical protein
MRKPGDKESRRAKCTNAIGIKGRRVLYLGTDNAHNRHTAKPGASRGLSGQEPENYHLSKPI